MRLRATLLLLAGMLAACTAEPPAPTQVVTTDAREVVAVVDGINPPERLVSLQLPDGTREAVRLGPEVRNFAQIRVGDEVVVRYREAVAVALSSATPGPAQTVITEEVARAPLGERPAIGAETAVTTTVRIEAVDPTGPTVTFTGGDGLPRTVTPQTEEMRAFARTLQPGDMVDVTFTEAVALSVEPAR